MAGERRRAWHRDRRRGGGRRANRRRIARAACWLAILLAPLLLACGGRAARPEKLADVVPALAPLPEASAIRLQQSWLGFGASSASYTLDRRGEWFEGPAKARGRQTSGAEVTWQTMLPLDVAQTFLRTLSETPVYEGEYQPRISRTDDYPSIEIQVETTAGPVVFFSKSQGENNVPWGVRFAGRTFVSDSALPAEALRALTPQLESNRPQPPAVVPATPPTAAVAPIRAGAMVNLVEHYDLRQAGAIQVIGRAVPTNRQVVEESERVEALVALLDRAVTVLEVAPERPGVSGDLVTIVFEFAGRDSVTLVYDPQAGTLTGEQPPHQPFTVPAPPDFARALGLE